MKCYRKTHNFAKYKFRFQFEGYTKFWATREIDDIRPVAAL